MKSSIFKFLKSASGNVALAASLLAVPLIGFTGMALDYVYLYRLQSSLQSAVDSAALNSAKELGLANANNQALESVARNYVYNNLGADASLRDTEVETKTTDDHSEIKVTVSHVWEPLLLHYVMDEALPIKVTATAKLAGKATICMLGLDEYQSKSIHLKRRARLEAPECGVYSNSNSNTAIRVDNHAVLKSGITCSAGGFKGKKRASFSPEPITDCPKVVDPLADRPKPKKGSCDHKKFKVTTGTHVLYPGTYCNGLQIGGDAEVWLKPGILL